MRPLIVYLIIAIIFLFWIFSNRKESFSSIDIPHYYIVGPGGNPSQQKTFDDCKNSIDQGVFSYISSTGMCNTTPLNSDPVNTIIIGNEEISGMTFNALGKNYNASDPTGCRQLACNFNENCVAMYNHENGMCLIPGQMQIQGVTSGIKIMSDLKDTGG